MVTLIWLAPWHRVVDALPQRNAERQEPSVPMSRLVGRWSLWAMGIGHAFSNYGFYFLLAWLPLYLVQQRGLSIEEMTLLATLGYATQAAAALALGHISDRWTRSGRPEPPRRPGIGTTAPRGRTAPAWESLWNNVAGPVVRTAAQVRPRAATGCGSRRRTSSRSR